jgi:hypothetical protein
MAMPTADVEHHLRLRHGPLVDWPSGRLGVKT